MAAAATKKAQKRPSIGKTEESVRAFLAWVADAVLSGEIAARDGDTLVRCGQQALRAINSALDRNAEARVKGMLAEAQSIASSVKAAIQAAGGGAAEAAAKAASEAAARMMAGKQ